MNHRVIYIMGVSGCGKTTIGKTLSQKLNVPFYDGDQFHSQENIDKMKSGISLTDGDRLPWLKEINQFVQKELESNSVVIACSALKENYRQLLSYDIEASCDWVFLKGTYETIYSRMSQREGHFMPKTLLMSQFELLEEPKGALVVGIENSTEEIVKIIQTKLSLMKAEFGIIGLGVMGKSIARNLARNGFKLALFNQRVDGVEEDVAQKLIEEHKELETALGFEDLTQFVLSLETPRKIFLMVKAGEVVDIVLEKLSPLLSKGDVVIDGGNSFYKDTERRVEKMAQIGVSFMGVGVSGGEEGALKGPSIMPGGSKEAYQNVSRFFEAMAAKDETGGKCCALVGEGGAGHFVKMVHNGIEYAEMQLIAETYALLKNGLGLSNEEIANLFEQWLATDLKSYLLEISVDILRKKEGEAFLLDLILDKAGNKGTGSWTTTVASELGVPIPTITAALFARYQSAFKTERKNSSNLYKASYSKAIINLNELEQAYRVARIVNHHQGFHLIHEASKVYNWNINFSELARIWTNGCIIRSSLMTTLIDVLKQSNRILQNQELVAIVDSQLDSLAKVVAKSMEARVPLSCFSASTTYLLTYIEEHSSANMIQAQRDYFGAHTYQRVDDSGVSSHHTNWTE